MNAFISVGVAGRQSYHEQGARALLCKQRGPKTRYRRTGELIRQVIRYRFLDPKMSAEVIAQKLRQTKQLTGLNADKQHTASVKKQT